ncbi:MAG TPA: helix-turn-helix transcriptional regulator [Puia sp.]|nr:helix-turn-helix transcriptional regulator [Puia sp.]
MHSGETIKLLRTLKGFSQRGVAIKLGISQPAYCKLEKRKNVNDAQLKKILTIIACTKDDLEALNRVTQQ